MWSTVAPLAKFTRPNADGVERRFRLFALLDDCLRSPVVWLAGPPGEGKTTLVASYLQDRQIAGVWYQVDAEDADPAAFFHHLGLAVAHATPRGRLPMPLLGAEYLSDIAGFARRWFREFFSRLPAPAILVLDNCQDGTIGSAFHTIVEVACSECPSGTHVLIISRDEPAPMFARLQATERLVCFDKTYLRLTLNEARAIASGKHALPDEVVYKLYEASNGWAAGFTMMREAASRTGSVGPVPQEAELVTVFNYFATQVFDNASRQSRDILIRIAFVPHLTASLAERICGSPAAGQLLEHLYQRRLFTDRRGTGREATYQFHALFRTFLQAHAKALHTPEALRDIKRQAARALEESAQCEDALALYVESEDWAAGSRVLLGLSNSLSAQGRDQTLAAWADQLPDSELDANPKLLYFLGIGQAYANPELGRATLERAVDKFSSDDCQDMEIVSIVAIITVFVHAYSKWERMTAWADRLETLLSKPSRSMSPAVRDRGITRLLFARAYCSCDRPALERLAEQALPILESSTDVNTRLDVASQLLNAYCWIGDIARQEHVVSVAQALIHDASVRPWLRISWYTHASRYWWVGRADHARASEAIHRGLEIAEETGLSALNGYLYGLLFNIRIDEGDLEAATSLDDTIQVMQATGKRYAPAMVLPGKGLLALLQGDSVNARLYALAGLAATDEWGASAQRSMATFLLVVVLVATGEFEEARTRLIQYEAAQSRIPGRQDEYLLQLLQAYLALEQHDTTRCDQLLATALPIARKQGYVNHIYWYPPMMSRLYARALHAGIEADFAVHVVRRRSLIPESTAVEHWPWPLKVFTLGHFSILKDDRRVNFGRKAPTRLLMLLKAVVACGGRDVPVARLLDIVWPDLEGDSAAEALQVSMHRLRKLIGERSLAMREGRISLNADCVWTDVWAFERLLFESEAAAACGQGERALAVSRKALALYRGAFLGHESDVHWANTTREKWQAKYMAHVRGIGKQLVATGAFDEALTYYLQALEVDDLAEQVYQEAMRCCLRLGRRSEGLLLYRRLRANLSAHLAVTPSSASDALRLALAGPQ